MEHARDRYNASDKMLGVWLMLLIGLGITLVFAALWVDALLDLRAFPDAPTPMTVAAAAALRDPPRGTWIRLTDARVDCRFPPRRGGSGSSVYAIATDATGVPRVLLSTPGPIPARCDAWRDVPVTGVLSSSIPGRVAGLEWPGLDWSAWPTPYMNSLWTESGPADARVGLWFYPLLLFVGSVLLAGGVWGLLDAWRTRGGPLPALPRAAFAMPLSTGASSLAVMSIPVGVFQWLAFGPLFFAKHMPDWTALPIGVLWAVWFFATVGSLAEGWKRRASDVLLAPDALAVRGGPLHRMHRPWRAMDPARTHLVLPAGSPDGETVLVLDGETAAVTTDADEARSFDAVAATVHALHAQASGATLPEPPAGPPEVVRCEVCGAPVAPADADRVECAYCRAAVPMPQETRARLSALAQLEGSRAESERLVRRLLRQPGARATTALFAIAVPPLLLGWPAAGIAFDEFYQLRRVFDWHDGVALFTFAMCFTYGLSWLVRAQVVGREALRLIATRCAALPPRVAGGPASCHRCGAPLPVVSPEQLVVVCAYCRDANVLLVNLAPVARAERAQTLDLRAELRARLATRRRYRLVSLASVALLGVSAVSLWPAVKRMRDGRPRVAAARGRF